MAFNELIKNFERIREYMREFCVYGYKTRNEMTINSTRSYDNEKYRIESCLSEFVTCQNTAKGKILSVSADMKGMDANPLFVMWKIKSFTNNDIILHFAIFDILQKYKALSIREFADELSNLGFGAFDYLVIRKKFFEYEEMGLLHSLKDGNSVRFVISSEFLLSDKLLLAVSFFKNILPLGVLGSFIDSPGGLFSYQHTYYINTIDDEILLTVFNAIKQKKMISFNYVIDGKEILIENVLSVKVIDNCLNGRRYLSAYYEEEQKFFIFRLDKIKNITMSEYFENDYSKLFDDRIAKSGGISISDGELEYVTIQLSIDEDNEGYVLNRIKKEKENGKLKKVGENLFEFYIEVWDAYELLPWLRTLIGYITAISSNNDILIEKLRSDIMLLKEIYGG